MRVEQKYRWFFGVCLLGIALASGIYAVKFMIFSLSPLDPANQEKKILEIRKNQLPPEITKTLAAIGILHDDESKQFLWLGKVNRQWSKVKAGEYYVSRTMSPIRIFNVITSGVSIIHPITVREGENLFEIAADLEANNLISRERFLQICQSLDFINSLGLKNREVKDITSLEGYLFPDTYFFNRTMTPEDIARQMVRRFFQEWGAVQDKKAGQLGFSRHQIIILASIIEKETGSANERPMISSVFHNRLKKRMRLQSDPTAIYGMWEQFDGNLRRSDLQARNAYNTYQIAGLPMGPISNPGKEAIQAALFPAASDFLFFVSHNDGTHEFTTSLDAHIKAVRKFQLNATERKNKSWRDLRKRSINLGR
ncbi:MAG: endolytic transglycosylase MltG [Bdellovibrionota bacterium]